MSNHQNLAQPVGTVTLVFTDIEASTLLLRRIGADDYARKLAEHRRLIRESFGGFGGYEVDSEGDACFYSFASAPAAVAAVGEAMAALAPGEVRVRVGIHTGEAEVDPPKYVGLAVHCAARIMACAHGGQVVVSGATREQLDDEFVMRDLGDHLLKDFPEPIRLCQLGVEEFPPLRSLQQTNLPLPATSFVGRRRELAELVALLARDDDALSLLTLSGPGGTGKTRLALEAAHQLNAHFPDGIWWTSLVSVRDPAVTLAAIAGALGVKEQPGVGFAEVLVQRLSGKRALLVIDNVEHLLPDAADELATLQEIPGPRLLVTSREALHLSGEQVYPVPALEDADAVALFSVRARQLDPSFASMHGVAELCARLDDLPLAIELAAARTNVLTAQQIFERLGSQDDLLTSGARDAPARQRTLRAVIDWSYQLLGEDEKLLFSKLAVFVGGSSLEAAEAVCGADLDMLAALVDKNLLRRRAGRFVMLETIREFAADLLEESDRAQELRRRHLEYFLALVDRDDPTKTPPQVAALVAADSDNLRACIAGAICAAPELALRLAAMLWSSWSERGMLAEGRRWLEQTLRNTPDHPSRSRASALAGASWLAYLTGDQTSSRSLAEATLAAARVVGDVHIEVTALNVLGLNALAHESYEEARRLFDEAAALARLHDDQKGLVAATENLGTVAHCLGRWDEAISFYTEGLAMGAEWPKNAPGLMNIGLVEIQAGRSPAEAANRFEDVFLSATEQGDDLYAGIAIWGLGLAAASAGRNSVAAHVLAAASTQHEALGYVLEPGDRKLTEQTVERLRAELGADTFAAAWSAGRLLSTEDAATLALESIRVGTPQADTRTSAGL